MKMNSTKMTFMSMMILTAISTMSSNSFLNSWMMMEINMISFLPILTKSTKMKDQTMKYFIIQSMASSLMMMSMLMNSTTETPNSSSIVLMTSMLIKLGLIPFHMWVPMLMNSTSWETCTMMSTIQKIIPIIFISQLTSTKTMMLPMILSLIMAPTSAMNQLSTKKIMAFSSISNTPWMIMSMVNSKPQFIMFMSIYSTMTMMTMQMMKKMNILFINQMTTMKQKKKVSMMILCLSMSGMPPMTGFFPKWMIIQTTINLSTILTMSMISSSIIMSLIYIKMMSPMMMKSTQTKKTKKKETSTKLSGISNLFNFVGLPMMLILKSI